MAKFRGLNKWSEKIITSFLPQSIIQSPIIFPQAFFFKSVFPCETLMMFSATIFPVSSDGYPVFGEAKGIFSGVNGKTTFTAIPAAQIFG